MNDADPEPRSAINQTYVSESVARKKKRVTDATCLRDMVIIQKQYLTRDKEGDCHSQRCFSPNAEHFLLGRGGEEVPGEEGKERLELKRREVEEVELKKELGVSTGGGNNQKSSDCNTQNAGDDTPSVPSPSPASSGNVASV